MKLNKDNISLKYTEGIVLGFIWLIIFSGPIIFMSEDQTFSWDYYIKSILRLLPFFGLSLFNHFVLVPNLLLKDKKWTYFIAAIITAILFVFIGRINEKHIEFPQDNTMVEQRPPHQLPPHLRNNDDFSRQNPPKGRPRNPEKDRGGPNPIPPMMNFFLISILILGFDTGLRTVFRWIKLEKERDALEKESAENELAFLRNQVSPHFFMNMLNNIHALIDIDTEEAKGSVIRLSQLMRHLLYDSETEKIQLSKELEFIRNYVDLMRLRYSSKVDIQLNITSNIPDTNIPPLLFTSYLENAFKHGVSYREASFIHIDIDIHDGLLIFSSKNSNHRKTTDPDSSGIGIENSRKRLDLLFPNKYQLSTAETKEHYWLTLNIPL